jgi:hypothetical protein
VIPVDLVVAAIIAVAAIGPEAPMITQVASGGVNPLRYKLLVDNVRAWFTEHPLYDAEGQPIVVPEWQFPARGRVQKQLKRRKAIADRSERVPAVPPAARQAGVVGGEARGSQERHRPRVRVRPALRALHGDGGDLPGRQPALDLGLARQHRQGRVQPRSRAASTGRRT